jgi:hypothetical protein
MILQIDIAREYLEKALDLAAGSSTRASNQKGINPLIREIHQKDAKAYVDAAKTITETKSK